MRSASALPWTRTMNDGGIVAPPSVSVSTLAKGDIMVYRAFALFLAFMALALFASAPLAAQEKGKNTHTGKFVSAKGSEFMMEAKGKEHSHTLAADGKVIGADA